MDMAEEGNITYLHLCQDRVKGSRVDHSHNLDHTSHSSEEEVDKERSKEVEVSPIHGMIYPNMESIMVLLDTHQGVEGSNLLEVLKGHTLGINYIRVLIDVHINMKFLLHLSSHCLPDSL